MSSTLNVHFGTNREREKERATEQMKNEREIASEKKNDAW